MAHTINVISDYANIFFGVEAP